MRGWYWGLAVYVPIFGSLHAVVMPTFDRVEGAARYHDFLHTENEFIEGNFCKVQQDKWVMDTKIMTMPWPKKDVSIRLD
jgi:hypothetical protein